MSDAALLRTAFGKGARRVREAAGVRQEDVARAARKYGQAWNRARIAALEAGEKAISAEELALLPLVLTAACGESITLADLVLSHECIRLNDAVVISGSELVAIYGGCTAVMKRPATDSGFISEVDRIAAKRLGVGVGIVLKSSRDLWGRSLSAERDRIVAEQYAGASPDRLRALRGRVTRQLVEQLGRKIGEGDGET